MAIDPPVFDSYDEDVRSAPRLDLDVDVPLVDELEVEVQCAPTQALNEERDLRYAVAEGDEDSQIVSLDVRGGQNNDVWQRNVLRGL